MSEQRSHPGPPEEAEQDCVPVLVEGVRHALRGTVVQHRGHVPRLRRGGATGERKSTGRENWVRVEVIANVVQGTHERRVEEARYAFEKEPRGFYRSALG